MSTKVVLWIIGISFAALIFYLSIDNDLAKSLNNPKIRLSSFFKPYNNKESQVFQVNDIYRKYPCANTDRVVNKPNVRCEYQNKYQLRLGIFDETFMSKESLHLARLYINTVKLSITNSFYVQFGGLIDGSSWPPQGNCQALTMTGIRRLDNIQWILEDIILREIDGDFIETGVWKGGLCILAKSIFHAYKQFNRKIFLADSFDGIPPVNISAFPADAVHQGTDKFEILSGKYTGGQEAVVKNFNIYFNVLSQRNFIDQSILAGNSKSDPLEEEFNVQIEFLKGYFKDTLPKAIQENRFKCFSVLRLDGDIYQSTWESLEYLYPYLNDEGVVIVDDFCDWSGAFNAVHDFRQKYNIKTPIIQVYHKEGESIRGAYFLKPKSSNQHKYCNQN